MRQVRQQLREIKLRVYIMAAASAGEGGQDCRGSAATRIANEKAVLSIENNALHLALRDVVVDADRTVSAKHVQFFPLAQRVANRLSHGVLGQPPPSHRLESGFSDQKRAETFSNISY
jgi:hypothetical protein